MNLNLRYPNITGLSEKEQLAQIKSFLHQLVDELNYATTSDGGSSNQTYQVQGTEISYYELRSLIIQSLQKMETDFEQLSNKMTSGYVPKSGWEANKDIVTDGNGNVVAAAHQGGSGGTGDGTVTKESIETALGYTPADAEAVEQMDRNLDNAFAAVWQNFEDVVTELSALDGRVTDLEDGSPDNASGGAPGAFYTELARISASDGKTLRVICHGLADGETYGVHLYTASRRKGRRHDPWRHPSNENTGEGYTGKGYANLAGKKYDDETLYPDVPEWMPRGGFLQTEWEITASTETAILEIDIGTWLLPMLKPELADFDLDSFGLIGVSNGAIAPLLFQFRLVKDGTVGECRNTLRVGLRVGCEVDEDNGTVTHFPISISLGGVPAISPDQLYTSIK